MSEVISGERRIARAALLDRAAQAATGFATLGVTHGDAVCLMLRNDFPFFEASFAAAQLGAYPVPVNWHSTADELGYILRDCAAKALVIHADLLLAVAAGVPAAVTVLVVPTPPEIAAAYALDPAALEPAPGALVWGDWLAGHAPRPSETPPPLASMIYTSGTTGRPKGVRREQLTDEGGRQRLGRLSAMLYGLGEEMRAAMTGPLYHSSPNGYGAALVRAGARMVLQPRFDPEELLALIARDRITHLHMVPTMFVRLLKLPEETRRKYDVSSLRHVVHAAAPCPPEVKRAMIDWWGPVINEFYGSTELGIVTYCTAEEWLAHPGSVGRVLADATVRIYDEGGAELPAGRIGEVYARLHAFTEFTYHGDDAKRRGIERDGLITCGDIGWLDQDGFLFLCDRKVDMVISGGVNIYPAEIEGVLHGHPDIADCAVFGIPDAEFGESLMAIIQPRPGAALSAAAVQAFVRDRLAGYKAPRRVEFRDELPREDSGKIFKRRLRAPFWADAGRQI